MVKVKFSRNKCRREGVVSKRVNVPPQFSRKASNMTQDEAYQYYTDCKNGFQIDCFSERFEEAKPAMERYIESGLVSPRNMVVLDSPDARKYNLEKCASNVLEEKKLAKGWKDAQTLEYNSIVDLNGVYDAMVVAKADPGLTINRWKSLLDQFMFAQGEFAKYKMVVSDQKSNIDDVEFVREVEHNIRHAKFDAADTLKRWLSENRARKCFRCDTVISDTSTLTPAYSNMRGRFGSLPGLSSEWYSQIASFASLPVWKGDRVKEKGGRFGSQRAHLGSHF